MPLPFIGRTIMASAKQDSVTLALEALRQAWQEQADAACQRGDVFETWRMMQEVMACERKLRQRARRG